MKWSGISYNCGAALFYSLFNLCDARITSFDQHLTFACTRQTKSVHEFNYMLQFRIMALSAPSALNDDAVAITLYRAVNGLEFRIN